MQQTRLLLEIVFMTKKKTPATPVIETPAVVVETVAHIADTPIVALVTPVPEVAPAPTVALEADSPALVTIAIHGVVTGLLKVTIGTKLTDVKLENGKTLHDYILRDKSGSELNKLEIAGDVEVFTSEKARRG
jgi:hypothetical protein